MRPAVFLDRDGTLIEDVHYLSDPTDVRLLPGAADALRSLRAAGYASVLVTNQSAIGRGLATLDDLLAVHAEVVRQLERLGASLDDWRYATAVPTTMDRRAVDDEDRKPGPGMLRKAAADLALDLGRSWMVGDMISDALAGRNAGCRGTILVRTGVAPDIDAADPAVDHVVDDLQAATRLILALDAAPAASGRSRR